jgi:hypothetical protein
MSVVRQFDHTLYYYVNIIGRRKVLTLKSFRVLADRTTLRVLATRMAKDTSAMLSISRSTSHQPKRSKNISLMLKGLLK